MKRVRFETPINSFDNTMDESECQSPRPFFERQTTNSPDIYKPQKIVYSCDPVHRFECSDSLPYPLAKKTFLSAFGDGQSNCLPSSELNLSMLDSHEPRPLCKLGSIEIRNVAHKDGINQPNVLASIENSMTPPNVLSKNDHFFLRRTDLEKYKAEVNLDTQLNRLSLDKENEPHLKNIEKLKVKAVCAPTLPQINDPSTMPVQVDHNQKFIEKDCMCYHQKSVPYYVSQPIVSPPSCQPSFPTTKHHCQTHYRTQVNSCICCEPQIQNFHNTCHCSQATSSPRNTLNKKTQAIEKYEQSKKEPTQELEKQTNISKEKREPTIADLVKIIKLQNEQLQLLQDKVDKFISTSNSQQIQLPVQNYMTEHVALQAIDSEHKISIGVMTSFEMVRTSTVINKEIITQTTDNAQIQCNQSQMLIKEVVSKQPVHLNFLDGITPVMKPANRHGEADNPKDATGNVAGNVNEEKTLNEFSLYNVQVDNATTPFMSPEQSLYLDIRDYSDSDSSDDHSVGWTYYNKVMTHVNGMLQDSDMPSSASALYRNTRQQCVQMQIDKTNVSVTKRVKFGDDPLGVHQPHIYAGSTDTSLKMNQLAAKYLNSVPQRVVKPTPNPGDMSFATRNYMERHKILQGTATTSRQPLAEMPRFLDITALKQQPKLL